jgi:Xaa-Pro aminopeptidase
MRTRELVEKHQAVQAVARSVLAELGRTIAPDDTERTLAERALRLLVARGCGETWYHSCPALVLLGARSCVSISGRFYVPADEAVGELNAVTVDVSPVRQGIWGDCARTFFIEDGVVVDEPENPLFSEGRETLARLHEWLRSNARAEMTFEELFSRGNAAIESAGYENLDFKSNLGHTIVTRLEDRRYIASGNGACLGDAPLFTFEPHVRRKGGTWGFKHEDIYAFDDNGAAIAL